MCDVLARRIISKINGEKPKEKTNNKDIFIITGIVSGIAGLLSVAVGEIGMTNVKQWNGSSWEELESSASGGGISNSSGGADSSIAINSSGDPVVGWVGGRIKQYIH